MVIDIQLNLSLAFKCGKLVSMVCLQERSNTLQAFHADLSAAFVPLQLRRATSPEMAVVRPGIDPSTTASFPNKMEEKVNSCGTH